MQKQRKYGEKLFSLFIMFFMFIVFVFGVVLTGLCLSRYSSQCVFSSLQSSFLMNFGCSLLYYCVILLLSRKMCGVICIPLLLYLRAAIYSTAVFAYALNCKLPLSAFSVLYISGVLEMSGLLYLSTLSFKLSLDRRRNIPFRYERIGELKKGIMFAFICSVFGAAAESFL